MSNKFEWTDAKGIGLTVHSYGHKDVEVSRVYQWDDGGIDARFGALIAQDFGLKTLDEAKAWVEEQAWAWLAEVTA